MFRWFTNIFSKNKESQNTPCDSNTNANEFKQIAPSSDRVVGLVSQNQKKLSGHDIPLHHAVYMADKVALRAALERGDDVNQTDRLGKTALHYAARDGDMDIMMALIFAGSDVNLRDFGGEGSTPKEIAMEAGHQGYYENALLQARQISHDEGYSWLADTAQ